MRGKQKQKQSEIPAADLKYGVLTSFGLFIMQPPCDIRSKSI